MKKYAIIYDASCTNNDYMVFIPQYISEGTYDDSTKEFFDNKGQCCKHINSFDVLTTADVFYSLLIDEKELLEKYNLKDLDEAKNKYSEEAFQNIIVGKINFEDGSIKTWNLPLDKTQGLSNPILYVVDFDGESKVVLSKAQLYSLYLGKGLKKIKQELKCHLDNLDAVEEFCDKEAKSFTVNPLGISNMGIEIRNLKKKKNVISSPMEIYEYVTKRLIGQDEAVEEILSSVINNTKASKERELIKPFIIGPTGSGKSLIFKLIGECLDIPVICVDCNSLVQTGYEGKNINDVLVDLYHACDSDISKIERAIVVFDEIDKIASSGASVSDVGVQQALLKFIEGNEFVVEINRFSGERVNINTSMMTIAAAGAFDVLTNSKNNPIGYSSNDSKGKYKMIQVDDLLKYGMLPELLGRFNLFVQYQNVTKDMIYKGLTESEISPLKIKKEYYLEKYGVTLVFNDEFLERICSDAIKRRSGFRGLDQLMNKSLTKLSFKLQCEPNEYKSAIITSDIFDERNGFQLIKK